MKTPIEQVREALEYIGGVLTMHTSISTRRPTPDEYEHALKDCDTALTALKSLEGQGVVAWVATIRYPDGSESERYAATREGATQLGHESTRVSGTVISVLPLVRQSPQPSTPRLTADEVVKVVKGLALEKTNAGWGDRVLISLDTLHAHLTKAAKP